MNLHRAHTEILALAVAAVLILLSSVALNAPEAQMVAPQSVSQVQQQSHYQHAAVSGAAVSLQRVSSDSTGDWVRAEAVEAPVKQTRWVF